MEHCSSIAYDGQILTNVENIKKKNHHRLGSRLLPSIAKFEGFTAEKEMEGQGEQGRRAMPVDSTGSFARIEDSRFPEQIAALTHALELIDEMLMMNEEALMKAAGTNQMAWLEKLITLCGGDLTDAVESAASNGHVEVMIRLLQEVNRREKGIGPEIVEVWQMSAKTRNVLQKSIGAAATYGQLDVVSTFLPQIAGSGQDEDPLRAMHKATWKVLDEAAANGQLSVVQIAVEYASEWGYIELYSTSGEDDALMRALTGGHEAVATYLLGFSKIRWDLESAFEIAMKIQRAGLAEKIFALLSVC